jgi:hypothetical protein
MNIYTKFVRPERCPEKRCPPSQVESAGYIPVKKQVESFINAGIRLEEFRKSHYDFPEWKDTDEDFFDPTREKGFGLEDASVLQRQTDKTIERLKNEQADKRTDGAEKADSSGSGEGSSESAGKTEETGSTESSNSD